MAMIPGGHAPDDLLERYCLGSVPAAELEVVEIHLLACTVCQSRLRDTEAYVRTMQQATAQAAADELARQRRWQAMWNRFFRSLPATSLAAAVALALVWGSAPSFRRPPAAPPLAVSLDLTRGDENPRVHAPARRPLLLTLDLSGVAALESYRVRIVDARGAAVLDAAAKPDQERLSVTAPGRLARGTYWVRLYDPAQPRTLLREYGLALE